MRKKTTSTTQTKSVFELLKSKNQAATLDKNALNKIKGGDISIDDLRL